MIIFSSSDNFWVIKSRRIRWAGHVAYMGERNGGYSVMVVKSDRKNYLEEPVLDWRIILR
jgi:hypothetical protein